MVITFEHLLEEALCLSDEGRVALAERLIASLSPDPLLMGEQLAIARARADDLDEGRVQAIPGEVALGEVRVALKALASE